MTSELFDLSDFPSHGRIFRAPERVLLADTGPDGSARLDAISRYLHDIATLDVEDAGLTANFLWILRATSLTIAARPTYLQPLSIETACSGYGKAWAERRTRIIQGTTLCVDAAAIWVNIDSVGGRPRSLDPSFTAVYGPSAKGRHVSARTHLRRPDRDPDHQFSYEIRVTDLDIMGHVNNAVHSAFLEQAFFEIDLDSASELRATRIEFGEALEYGSPVHVSLWRSESHIAATLSQNDKVRSQFLALLASS